MALVALGSGCSRSDDVMTPAEFTEAFAEALRRESPGTSVEIVADLHLEVTSADGVAATSFLDNAYATYRQDPAAGEAVIRRYVTASLEAPHGADTLDRTRIVPVVKDRPWLDETARSLRERGAKETVEHVFEEFAGDLVIVYAQDHPQTIQYLTPAQLEKAGIERSDLRALACENLRRLLPAIQLESVDGLHRLTGGGDYDASLLLLDSIWNSGQIDVPGEIVVAVPTRDLLIVAGSEDAPALDRLRRGTAQAASEGPYRLSAQLLVYRDGRFQSFDGAAPAAAERVSVVLVDAGERKIQAIKVVREVTGLGLRDAKDLVDNVPSVIRRDLSARELAERLRSAGLRVEIR